MKLLSWNINGIKSALKKGILLEMVESGKYDVVLLQETKAKEFPDAFDYSEYNSYFFKANKPAYSGTAIITRIKPLSVTYGFGDPEFDNEGRVITAEFDKYYVVNSYFPNSRRELTRLDYKLAFNKKMLEYLEDLRKSKPVIIGGDFNVAHTEIDIARPKENVMNPGFTEQERAWMTKILQKGYIDTYREFIKDSGHYSWWSLITFARKRNIGWRIDYFITSDELKNSLRGADILENVYGSDHAPVYLEVDV